MNTEELEVAVSATFVEVRQGVGLHRGRRRVQFSSQQGVEPLLGQVALCQVDAPQPGQQNEDRPVGSEGAGDGLPDNDRDHGHDGRSASSHVLDGTIARVHHRLLMEAVDRYGPRRLLDPTADPERVVLTQHHLWRLRLRRTGSLLGLLGGE